MGDGWDEHATWIATVARRLQTHAALAHIALPPVPAALPPPAPAAVATVAQVARLIDHTLLKPEATPQQVERLCHEAREHGFASVCVNPCYVAHCVALLQGSGVAVCSVAGFPLGATTSEVKAAEALQVCRSGGREVDMVIACGLLKAGDYAAVYADVAQVVAVCQSEGAQCKVIIETALLDDDEKIAAALLAVAAGADYVKTSTGFASSGATVHDVVLLRRTVGASVGVKAAGGIRTLRDAQALIAAGATRLGTSASVAIVQGSSDG